MNALADMQDIDTALDAAISSHGDRPAFRNADGMLTYAQLSERIAQKSVAYDAAGISGRSTVGVMADNTAEFLSDVFALLTKTLS